MSTHSMERFSLKNLAWILILLFVWVCGCKGCIEEEKLGLLEFKAFLKLNGENANALLPSWVDTNNITECCSWERVVCDPSTGRVKKLLLSDIRKSQQWLEQYSNVFLYKNDKSWLLNLSVFLPFEELQHLNLSVNSFDGFINNEEFEVFSSLKKLEVLDICGNEFDKSVLKSLGMRTSLKTLSLCSMGLKGSFPIEELANLKNLEVLNLRYNHLESFPLAQEFACLRNLKVLDLSWNHLKSFQVVQGFKSISKLQNLEILHLEGNQLDKTIIKQLRVFTSLKTLDISHNSMGGPFPSQELSNFRDLTKLVLSSNNFRGSLTIQDFESLTNLEILDLSYNSLSGIIPSSIRLMSSLKSLSLAYNMLNGSLSNQGLCQLNKLQELDLANNLFEGILPPCLYSLTSLRSLDLSYNSFSGNLASSLLANLPSLEYINLSNNLFEGSISLRCFANQSKLQAIIFGSHNNKFSVETEDSVGWVPLFQLKVLVVSNCKLTGGLPNFLQYQFKLRVVDLSHNNLIGRFPNWLLEKNMQLEYLILRNNSLTGLLLLNLCPHITLMDISDNKFDGKMQGNLVDMIPNLNSLNLSNNGFEGILPSSIADFKYLMTLDLSTNNFFGEVPKKLLAVGNCDMLKLSNNKFEGEIFSTKFNISIGELYLDNNRFRGILPHVFVKSSELMVLDVSNNRMSGEIPSGIGNLTSLQTLALANNSFKGKLPYEISQLRELKFLDVSRNALSGHLPNLNTMERLQHLHLQRNMFEGSIPTNFLNSSSLLTLDIRYNRLFGEIPNSISLLSELRILLLGGNLLSGSIPNQLCHLRDINLMDLSNNNFYGLIPSCFGLIRFGDIRIEFPVFGPTFWASGFRETTYEGNLAEYLNIWTKEEYYRRDEVEFVTKYRSNYYRGGILDFMYGLDLSCNNLTGEIPHELGMLSWVRTLNLSHNQLKGIIPNSFSNLSQIESLDLSYNQLSGEIPLELTELHFLSVFNVAHNNISGSVPEKPQLDTFGESSYEDNPFLCGRQLKRKCNTSTEQPTYSSPKSLKQSEEKWYDVTFFATFATTYITVLLSFFMVLYINPYWRRRWVTFVEKCMYSCYYFSWDTNF